MGKKKAEIDISIKKLPKIYKRSYKSKKLKRKVLSKIHIPQDREFVEALFEADENPKKNNNLAIKKDRTFSKSEIKKLKAIAKDIKSHKFRIKLLPLIASLSFIAAVVIFSLIFKNPLLKKALITGCQSAFEAKTEINYLDVSFINTRITIKGIAIGNKESEYKNIFEADKLELDFNIVQALRGCFVCENMECSGMRFNTDRKTSCILAPKKKKEKKQKQVSSSQKEENPDNIFTKAIDAQINYAMDTIQYHMINVLGGTDVDSIVRNIQQKLESPKTVMSAIDYTNQSIDKWSKKPDEIENQITDFYCSVVDLQSIDITKIDNIEILKEDIDKVKKAIDTSMNLRYQVEDIVHDVNSEYQAINNIYNDVKNGIESDIQYTKDTLTSIKAIGDSSKEILDGGLDTLGYSIIGKYYPLAKKAAGYAQKYKEVSTAYGIDAKYANAKKEQKSVGKKRMKGTTFWYGTTYPKFLIKNVKVSGVNFEVAIKEVSNDQNIRNRPTTAYGKLILGNVNHTVDLMVDARRKTDNHLVSIDYSGRGFESYIDGTSLAVKMGVPSLKGKSDITMGAYWDKGAFSATGDVSINPLSLYSDGFDNQIATKYYNQALGYITDLNCGYRFDYSDTAGADLEIMGNFGEQFVNALTNVALDIATDIKNEAIKQIESYLHSYDDEINQVVNQVKDIYDRVEAEKNRVIQIQKDLEKLLYDMQHQAEDYARQLVEQTQAYVNETIEQTTQAAEELKRQTEEQVKQAADLAAKEAEEAKQQTERQAREAAEEAERKLREAAEEAAREAQRQAEEAAKEATKNAVKNLFGGGW